MKKTIIAIAAFTLLVSACDNKEKEFDATGIFEATEVTVSAEATGIIRKTKRYISAKRNVQIHKTKRISKRYFISTKAHSVIIECAFI